MRKNMNVRNLIMSTAVFFISGACAAAGAAPPYKVVDGTKVDGQTLQGWKTWRAMACERRKAWLVRRW
jgi:hypothetical protein